MGTGSVDNLPVITKSNTSELPPLMKSDRMHLVTIDANLTLRLRVRIDTTVLPPQQHQRVISNGFATFKNKCGKMSFFAINSSK